MSPDSFNRLRNNSREDFDRFVSWLFSTTLSEAQASRGDLAATREVWLHFFRRGLQAGLLLDELMKLLPELFLRAQYPDGEKQQVLELIKAINVQELGVNPPAPAPDASARPTKNCSYCGRENEAAAATCRECGTVFEVELPAPDADSGTVSDGRSLHTGIALLHCLAQPDLLTALGVVQSLSADAEPPENEDPRRLEDPNLSLVTVRTFKNAVDAGVLKSRLEAAGIEACIPEEYAPQIFLNVIPCPLQSVTVRVAAKDHPAAMEILANISETSLSTPMPGTVEPIEAPAPPAESREETPAVPGKRCVACNAGVPADAALCPQCGWTQPDRG